MTPASSQHRGHVRRRCGTGHDASPADALQAGRIHALAVAALTQPGALLAAPDGSELFVPRSQLPPGLQVGERMRVFIYRDRGRLLATARMPLLQLGQVGGLLVSACSHGTAYLELGIPKELVVPVSEQHEPFAVGQLVTVYMAMDEQGRLFGTQHFSRYLQERPPLHAYRGGERVVMTPLAQTPLGFRMAVDDRWFGLLHHSEVHGPLQPGQRLEGHILRVREDGRLDLCLQPPGQPGIEQCAAAILQAVERAGGELALGDRSPPDLIERELRMSKASFKKAVGRLYRSQLLVPGEHSIRLITPRQGPG